MNPPNPQSSQASNTEFHAIGFQVGAEEYGLELRSVQEIIATPRITRVPKAPPYIRGVINLHGNVVPVLDVARRFGLGDTAMSSGSKVVVVETEGESIGLLAESVSKVTRFHRDQIQPPPPLVAGIAADFLDGIIRSANRFVIFLNLDKTLEDDHAGTHGRPIAEA